MGAVVTIIRLGASTILARSLAPDDFWPFLVWHCFYLKWSLRVGALGLGIGIIAKQNVTEDDLSTAFWTMALIRVILFLITFSCSSFLASFFNEARLIPVIQAVSFTFLFQIMGIIGNTLLKKNLFFQKIFIITIISSIFESGTALLLVVIYTKSYWALVFAMVSSRFLNNFLVFILARWVPKWKFSKKSFAFLFRYGINSLGSSLTEYFNSNADYFIIGKVLGPKILGFYEFAYRIPFLIQTRISYPLRDTLYPTLAILSDSHKKLSDGSIKGVTYIALICFPCLGGLAIIAELMVRVLWGEQWLTVVAPLKILCCASAIKCVCDPMRDLFNCLDRPDIPFKFSLISLVFTVISVSTLGYFFGIIGIAWAMMVSTLPVFFLLLLAFSMMKASFYELIKGVFPIIISTLCTMIVAYFVQSSLKMTGLQDIFILFFSIFFGALAYWISLKIGFKNTYSEITETGIEILGLRKNKALNN